MLFWFVIELLQLVGYYEILVFSIRLLVGFSFFCSPQRLSFVGGRVASLGGLAELRPTFEVHNFCQVSVIEWYSDCP